MIDFHHFKGWFQRKPVALAFAKANRKKETNGRNIDVVLTLKDGNLNILVVIQ